MLKPGILKMNRLGKFHAHLLEILFTSNSGSNSSAAVQIAYSLYQASLDIDEVATSLDLFDTLACRDLAMSIRNFTDD